jgi:hypothetical protein
MVAGRIIAVLSLVALLTTTAAAQAPRTPFDRLDLATPQSAVARFVAAYRGRDYVTVFWILSPQSQNAWIEAFQTFNLGQLTGPLPADLRSTVMQAAIPPMAEWDQTDTSWLFDHLMVTVESVGALPLRLPEQGTAGESLSRADGTATVGFGSGPGAVKFRLVRSPAGQWRVSSVVGAGGNPERPPWGIERQP